MYTEEAVRIISRRWEHGQVNTQTQELSFNDIPKAMTQLLDKQQRMEEKLQALQKLMSLQRVENTHYPMTVPQVSAYTDLPVSTIYEMLEKKEIPACKLGKHWQIYRDELDQTIMAHRVNEIPLSPVQRNSKIMASHKRQPKNAGKYANILSSLEGNSTPMVSKGLSHDTGMIQC